MCAIVSVIGGEVVGQGECRRAELDRAVTIIRSAGLHIERTVPRREIDIVVPIGYEALSCLKDAATTRTATTIERLIGGSGHKIGQLLERGSVVSNYPAMPDKEISRRPDCHVDRSVEQQ